MKKLMTALATSLAIAATACGPDYDRTDIQGVIASPLGGRVDRTRIEVPVGMIVKAHIVPWNDDREPMEATIRSRDPGVVEVAQVVSDRDYAFLGLRRGTTQIEIRADGDLVLVIDAIVSDQAPAP